MPEDSKKNDKKTAKEQRKPRQRHQQGKNEKRSEKVEESASASAPKVPQKPPVYESPPPEFYKSLKRETDEILKITEEESSKYKKKEIQSNWSKYEVPIESYEEIDAQENLGADYEKLIEAPLSLGGHFQFKHEKSWDMNTCSSQYDKYFNINMEELNIALCTIPFYDRNNIEQTVFNETEILTMNNRSTRFKQKYYNDKSYSTPEVEAQDKILNSLRDNLKTDNSNAKNTDLSNKDMEIKTELTPESPNIATDINLDFSNEPINTIDSNKIIEENILNTQNVTPKEPNKTSKEIVEDNAQHDDFIFVKTDKGANVEVKTAAISGPEVPEVQAEPQTEVKKTTLPDSKPVNPQAKVTAATLIPAAVKTPEETKKNPVIESPEDLEKWLDDFLDG